MGTVTAARRVVERKQCEAVDGVLLDLFTASHIVALADAVSEENCEKLDGLHVTQAAKIAYELVKS